MSICKFPFIHKWERYISKEYTAEIKISRDYYGGGLYSIGGSLKEQLTYPTVVTQLTRYCERCGDKQVKHVDILHIKKVEMKV